MAVTPGTPGIPGSTGPGPDPVDVEADLVVIGPEVPLVAGLADRLRARGRLVLGPGADGARLEGSKAWMKDLLHAAEVPTARSGAFSEPRAAIEFMRSLPPPYVVKTDGLAAGKGVLVTPDLAEAEADVRAKLEGTSFGEAGRTVVIEEGFVGPELSVLALCDGERAWPLTPARDHKRVGDGDTGPNTGGMGAFSPVPGVDEAVVGQVMDRAVLPTLAALRRRGVDYRGVLYAGLMLTSEGPKVIEFNVRFGDPEAQVVLPRLRTDLVALCAEAAAGGLHTEPAFTDDAAVTVACASKGYPTSPSSGDVIEGVDAAAAVPGVSLHWAGVDRDGSGRFRTAGGRVVWVTALGPDLPTARQRAYDGVDRISFPGMHHRKDIAA